MGEDAANDLSTTGIPGSSSLKNRRDLDDVPRIHSVGREAAPFLDLHNLGVDDVEVVDAALLGAPEEDDELRPPFGVLQRERLDVALLIAEGGESVEDARLCAAPFGDQSLHGEARPIGFDILALKSRHVAVLPVNRKHDGARACDIGLVPHPEGVPLHAVEDAPDDPEEDAELVDRLLALFQRAKQEVKHVLAEGVKPFHGLTPFVSSR